jgi:parallel beta-helix repeat protein
MTIGGGGVNEGNIISGNRARGIYLSDCDTFNIRGNTIGLAADQSTVMDNDLSGIEIILGSDEGQIGGAMVSERNIISSNLDDGITLNACDNIIIQGNYIGIDGTGAIARGNTGEGISANNCEFIQIGGDQTG